MKLIVVIISMLLWTCPAKSISEKRQMGGHVSVYNSYGAIFGKRDMRVKRWAPVSVNNGFGANLREAEKEKRQMGGHVSVHNSYGAIFGKRDMRIKRWAPVSVNNGFGANLAGSNNVVVKTQFGANFDCNHKGKTYGFNFCKRKREAEKEKRQMGGHVSVYNSYGAIFGKRDEKKVEAVTTLATNGAFITENSDFSDFGAFGKYGAFGGNDMTQEKIAMAKKMGNNEQLWG